jgi:hypothetical protein
MTSPRDEVATSSGGPQHSERGEVGVGLRSDGHRLGGDPTIIAHGIEQTHGC